MRKRYFLLPILLVALTILVLVGKHNDAGPSDNTTTSSSRANTSTTSQARSKTTFNKKRYSLTDPDSLWVIANKHRPLSPKSYAPNDLVIPNVPLRVPGNESMKVRQPTATALQSLFAAAKANGTPMMLSSGYRSYTFQVSLYGGYVKTQGQETADSQSARPGYSEHQTGLAADLEPLDQSCNVETCFADTPAGQWLATNAYKYGFIIRYQKDDTSITGYTYEPWHVRYIGVDLANELHSQNVQTLEQFFNTGSAPDYN